MPILTVEAMILLLSNSLSTLLSSPRPSPQSVSVTSSREMPGISGILKSDVSEDPAHTEVTRLVLSPSAVKPNS